jgi:hypothetical protein
MLHLRREVVPAGEFDGELPDHRHAAMALARGVGICILAVGALGVFLVGALALGAVVMID